MISTYTQQCPVLFGVGAANQVADKVKEFGGTRAFCIYDQGVKMTGSADRIIKMLQDAGIETICFDGVLPDAPDFLVNEVGILANESAINIIIGIGGGSTLDTAKAVAVLVDNPGPINQYYAMYKPKIERKTPLILLPTASGTGSEVTIVSVIHDHKLDSKNGVLRPASLAIVDPELTLTAPPHITASTGLDALSHAVESYTNIASNPRTELLSLAAIDIISKNLEKAYLNGSDIEARTNMSFASNIAGIAFSDTFTHFGHAAAHEFGVRYHMPHGIGCAISLPEVITFASDIAPEKSVNLAKAFGVALSDGITGVEAGELAAAFVRELMRKVGIQSLREQGISREEAVACADRAVETCSMVALALKPVDTTIMAELIGKMYDNYL